LCVSINLFLARLASPKWLCHKLITRQYN
jgi:hypothetical protein